MDRKTDRFLGGLALFWAGAAISGNMIAAPAKFSVDALTLDVALQVGRAQFTAIGYLEYCLAGVIACMAVLSKRFHTRLSGLAVVAFGVQHLILMPRLNDRSDLIINGMTAPDGHTHLIFIGVEALKIAILLAVGLWSLFTFAPKSVN